MQDFTEYFNGLHPAIQVEVNPLVPQQLINQYLQGGRVTKLRFVRFSIPADVTDAYDAGGHVEEEGHVELVVSARRNRRLPIIGRVRDVIDGRRNVREMVELHDFEYDTVKVEIEMEGSRRTIDLSDVMKLRAYYEVTSELQIGPNGHPVFNSIDGVARDLMGGLLDSLGTGGSNV